MEINMTVTGTVVCIIRQKFENKTINACRYEKAIEIVKGGGVDVN